MSLADYLTKNYMSSDKKSKKSKKEKKSTVIDESISLTPNKSSQSKPKDGAIKLPNVKKQTGWKVVGTDEVLPEVPVQNTTSETETKEQIQKEEEEKKEQTMASGAKAGLQTGAQVAEQIRQKEQKDKELYEKEAQNARVRNNETIHRDSTGRKLNIDQLKEQEANSKEFEKLQKERRLRELNMGLVQKLELEESRKKLANAANSGINKYVNDVELNDELKRKEMEDDPLLSFKPSKSRKYVSRTGRKLYRSGFPENRFNITPGYRWDGVDRSNGFEKAWFKKQVERENHKTLSYTMQDDY